VNHAAQLARLYEQFQAQGVQVLIIGAGTPKEAERLSRSLQRPIPILMDPEREVYLSYGLDRVLTYQRSGTYLINKDGFATYIHQATNPQASLNKTELLEEIAKLQNP
jgi:peroxiredoxin